MNEKLELQKLKCNDFILLNDDYDIIRMCINNCMSCLKVTPKRWTFLCIDHGIRTCFVFLIILALKDSTIITDTVKVNLIVYVIIQIISTFSMMILYRRDSIFWVAQWIFISKIRHVHWNQIINRMPFNARTSWENKIIYSKWISYVFLPLQIIIAILADYGVINTFLDNGRLVYMNDFYVSLITLYLYNEINLYGTALDTLNYLKKIEQIMIIVSFLENIVHSNYISPATKIYFDNCDVVVTLNYLFVMIKLLSHCFFQI